MISYKTPNCAPVLIQDMNESSIISRPTIVENSSNVHLEADLLTQVRIGAAVERITQYIADNSVSRLEWWLNSDRTTMREEATWNSVFFHISHGASVGEADARHCAAAVQITPARSEARTAVICAADGRGFAVAFDCAFSQAGVVAPPDGLTGETFNIYRDVQKPV